MSDHRIMGIDHGMARVGLALSDPLLMFATPLCILTQKSRTKTLQTISELVAKHSVQKIVIGLPRTADGFLSRQAEVVLEWAEALAYEIETPLVFWDESYSSMDADRAMHTTGKRRAGSKDDVAAAIILQEYLTALQDNHEPGQTIEAIRENE